MKYRADIDGLRALAVVSVMLYHLNARWLPGGYIGVDVFFVISGFVVCASLAASKEVSLGAFIREFYARRLARIVPALVVMLLAAATLAALFIPSAWFSDLNDSTARYAFFGLSNWLMSGNTDTYFAPRAELNPYIHTWSLGVEEQFYVIFPLMCFLWVRARTRGSRRAFGMAAGLALIAALSLAGSRWATHQEPNTAFYSIVFRFWELAAGALLFQVTAAGALARVQAGSRLSTVAPWLGLALVGLGFALADPLNFPYPWALTAVAGTLLLIGGVAAAAHPLRRVLASRAAVAIGKRSYSLYLWHWPVFVLMRWTAGLDAVPAQLFAVAVTFLLASASYRWIERPLRHNAALERLPSMARIAFFLLVVAGGFTVADAVLARQYWIGRSVVARNATDWYARFTMPFPERQERRCDVSVRTAPFAGGTVFTYRPSKCTGGLADVNRLMEVFGDSHATAYTPVFDRLSAETGVTVHVYTFTYCPYLDLLAPMTDGKPPGCVEFWQEATRTVLTEARPGDILFMPSLRQRRFNSPADTSTRVARPEMAPERSVESIAQATREAVSWLQPFADRRMSIVFEAPTPLFRSPPYRCSDWFNSRNPMCEGGLAEQRAYLERRRAPIVAAMQEIAARQPAVRVWDPFPVLCPSETCLPFRDGRPLFFDFDHLSAYGNARLYPSFKATVDALADPRHL